VVVGILVLLASIMIPAMRPMAEERQIREAARAVNVSLSSARNRAAVVGRPVGVMFERLERQPEACVTLRQAEVPPPYSGDMEGAAVRVQDWTYTAAGAFYWPDGSRVLKVRVRDNSLSPGLVRWGDRIQINYQGPWYTIVYDTTGNPYPADFPPDANGVFIDFNPSGKTVTAGWIDNYCLTLILDGKTDYQSPFPEKRYEAQNISAGLPTWSHAMPFQILRQPVPSAVSPVKLAGGAVVELAFSGTDSLLPATLGFRPEDASDRRPVMVMFSPNGSVDRVYFYHPANGYGGYVVTEPIYFMIGKWERLLSWPGGAAQAEDGYYNYQDAANLWAALNPQTGLVTVAEVHADQLDPATNTYIPSGATPAEQVFTSRRFAREAQISKGGR